VTVHLPYKFTPRDYQKPLFKAIVEDGVKRAACVWHRRAGKDKTFLNILAIMGMLTKANYAYYFPTAVLGRKALWDNIDARTGMKVIDHLPSDIVEKKNEQQMKITLVNGSIIQVLGTDSLDVVGGNYYGVIFSEAAQQNPLAWDYTRPILRENGGWALLNGTPRGKNWWYKLFTKNITNPAWFCQYLTIDDTKALTEVDINEERKAGMSEDLIKQEYYCDWTIGMPGAIYAQQIERARLEKRICDNVMWFKELPVYTVFDVGAPLNQKCWVFQMVGDRINYLEFLSGDNDCKTPADWSGRLRLRPYSYGSHFIPHDACTENGGLWQGGFETAGLSHVVGVPRQVSVWDGINLAQDAFPRIFMNASGCEKGIEGLAAYHSKEEKDGATISNVPVHDWASHAADPFSLSHQAIHKGLVLDRTSVARKPRNRMAGKVLSGYRG